MSSVTITGTQHDMIAIGIRVGILKSTNVTVVEIDKAIQSIDVTKLDLTFFSIMYMSSVTSQHVLEQ